MNDKTPTTREVEGVLSREPRGGTLAPSIETLRGG
jgi:hypothetical protein